MENALTYIGIALLALVLFWWIKLGQYPRRNTQRLAITVWAAFGPTATAQHAEDLFRTVASIVFDSEGLKKTKTGLKAIFKTFTNGREMEGLKGRRN